MIREYATTAFVLVFTALATMLLTMCGSCSYYKTVEVQMMYANETEVVKQPLDSKTYAMLEEVHERTGFWINPVDKAGFKIEIVPGNFRVRGKAWRVLKPCWYFVRSTDDPRVLAHELAHVLGLSHVADKNNLMDDDGNLGPELKDWQLQIMDENAKTLERLCWDSGETDFRFAELEFGSKTLCSLEFKDEIDIEEETD